VGVQFKPGVVENNTALSRVSGVGHFGDLIGFICSERYYSSCGISR